MIKNRCRGKLNNAGFSLIELIIVVSILAIAAVPLMKSMSMSTKVNAKAQSIQNATSLGERVMEEVKSSDIAQIVKDHGGFDESTQACTYTYPIPSATQGEAFEAKVTISKGTYSGNTTPVADKKANVKSANTLLIPKIEDIDTLSQAVLSPKELNKYDTEALSYFNQKLANYPTDKATIKSKKVDIIKKDVTYPTAVTVKATVTYTDDASPANKYVKELYTGTFTALNKEGSTTDFKPLDSNIYIFYKKNEDKTDEGTRIIPEDLIENIVITDDSSYVNPVDTTSKDSHRVYFIRQDKNDWVGPKLTINGTDFTYANVDTLEADGTKIIGKTELVTNLVRGDKSKEGHIYKEEARVRVYEITVDLYKNSELVTSLNSTVSASDKITPTPTPTTEP